jgi:hypothetical protein
MVGGATSAWGDVSVKAGSSAEQGEKSSTAAAETSGRGCAVAVQHMSAALTV